MSKGKELRLIDKPIFRYWHALYMSFYSPNLYRDVFTRWRGFGGLYLLLVIAVASIPLSVKSSIIFHDFLANNVLLPLKKMPVLYIQNGEVNFDEPMPYIIKNTSGEVILIVDTTGKVKKITDEYPELTILITKTKFYYRTPKLPSFFGREAPEQLKKISIYRLEQYDNEVFDPKLLMQNPVLSIIQYISPVLVYTAITSIIYSSYLVLLFVLPMLGQITTQIFFTFKLKYKEACRLFAVAATPQIIIMFILMTMAYNFTGIGVIYLILLAGYFFYAVICIKSARTKMVKT